MYNIKIAIPRALLFYEYYPLWETFFTHLGAKVVLSPKTTKDIMNDSIKYSVNEACLPVKIFHGHVKNLIDKADYLFIPRIKSVERMEYICPKISGLPEMIKFSVPFDTPIIDTEVNLRKSKRNLKKSFFEAGLFITKERAKIKAAIKAALQAHDSYLKAKKIGKTPSELLEKRKLKLIDKPDANIAILGHSYNLYDEYISMGLLKKLNAENVNVLTPEMLDYNTVKTYSQKVGKKVFWSLGKRQIGALFKYLEQRVDGIIYVMAFGCGIDSFIADLCERYAKRKGIPFYLIMLDEHSGEAGLKTRLEAFLDMIKWRKKDENYCPAYR